LTIFVKGQISALARLIFEKVVNCKLYTSILVKGNAGLLLDNLANKKKKELWFVP